MTALSRSTARRTMSPLVAALVMAALRLKLQIDPLYTSAKCTAK